MKEKAAYCVLLIGIILLVFEYKHDLDNFVSKPIFTFSLIFLMYSVFPGLIIPSVATSFYST